MAAAPTMVSQDPPVLEASYRMLDPGSTATMSTPRSIAQDPVSAEDRGGELANAAVTAVGEDATMLLAERLDARASVVNRVVAVAWTACGVAAIPRSRRRMRTCALHDQR